MKIGDRHLGTDTCLSPILIAMTLLMITSAHADITTELAGHWKLDEGSGTTAVDSSDKKSNGILSNSPQWIPGVKGQALLFDTDNDAVRAPLAGLDTYSYSFFIYPFNTGTPGSEQWPLSQNVGGNNPCHAFQYLPGNHTLSLYGQSSGFTVSATLPQGRWSHVIAVNDPKNKKSYLYVNGDKVDGVKVKGVGESIATGCSQPFNKQIVFGSHPSSVPERSYRGGLDEIRVYDRVLTGPDIAELFALYNGTTISNPPVIISSTTTQILSVNSSVLSVVTGSPATCRYGTSPAVNYNSMPYSLTTTDGFSHSATVPLQGGTNNFYVRCKDTASNTINQGDFIVPILVHQTCLNANATEYFVTPDGQSTNCGDIASPWSFVYAASGAEGKIKPGNTVWVRGGAYSGSISVRMSGTPGSPITLRNYNRERATFDGQGVPSAFAIRGNYLRLWGLEIVDSLRSTVTQNPYSVMDQGGGVGVSYINMVSHDGGMGVSGGDEAYGNILYYNGKTANDHGIYWQNDISKSGIIKIEKDNIILNPSGSGIHSYSQVGPLDGFLYEGNTVYNANAGAEILVGGGTGVDHVTLQNNMIYHVPGVPAGFGGGLQIGYKTTVNRNAIILNNYISENGGAMIINKPFDVLTMRDNTFIALYHPLVINLGPSYAFGVGPYDIDNNTYYNILPGQTSPVFYSNTINDDCKVAPRITAGDCGVSLAQWRKDTLKWKSVTGFDANSTVSTARPADKVFVRANQYESGRANITIYNWSHADNVSVDISKVDLFDQNQKKIGTGALLNKGDAYELRSAQDYYGDVTTVVYQGGLLTIPMTGRSVAKPLDPKWPTALSTFPEFGAFVLIRTSVAAVGEEVVLAGDVSKDGKITMYDAALVLRYTLGALLSDTQKKAADINADNKIDGADVMAIARKALGL